jgi:TRAP-type mannitol/chloroaromatic compound transport system substrate-binding protein
MSERIILKEKKYGSLEESLRLAFEKAASAAFAEMNRQAAAGYGDEFKLVAEVKCENGQGFKMTIEFFPPTIPTIPSRN